VPLDLIPGAPKASVSLGSGAHSPQIKFEADSSCIWDDFPVALRACPFRGGTPRDPSPTSQTIGYSTGFGAGPFQIPSADMPILEAYNVVDNVLAGYQLEARVTGTITFGTAQIGVVNPSTGGASDPSGTYYSGAFDTGWFDANTPDCAQAATTPGPIQALDHAVILRPFSPIIGCGITGCVLQMRWVVGGGSATWAPFQPFTAVFGPPLPSYIQSTLYDWSSSLVGFAGSSGTTPPAGMQNEIVPGDADLYDDGHAASGTGTAWYDGQAFASSCRATVFVHVVPGIGESIWIFARLVDPGTGTVTGYAASATPTSSSSKTFELWRIDAGVYTSLGSVVWPTGMSVADGFGIVCDGDQISFLYHDGESSSAACYLDPFNVVLTETDGTYRSIESPANVGYAGAGIEASTGKLMLFEAGSYPDVFPGLVVYLETNSCGVLTKTYTQIATAVNALSIEIAATTLGGHGGDTAEPTKGLMGGADCSGGVNDKGAVPL
jgi:hypothetical protein